MPKELGLRPELLFKSRSKAVTAGGQGDRGEARSAEKVGTVVRFVISGADQKEAISREIREAEWKC